MQIGKVRISADGIELEVEGVDLDLPDLLTRITDMRRALGPARPSVVQVGVSRTEAEAPPSSPGSLPISTNTIASLTNASTGSDLVMAAMAHITLVQRKEVAARREIHDEMKGAKTFYRETFGGNLSSYLDSLAKAKRLNLVAKETYALPNIERQNFERLIAAAG